MKNKVSKAQQEVWEWKEQTYEELKHVPEKERLAYVMNKVKDTMTRLNQKEGIRCLSLYINDIFFHITFNDGIDIFIIHQDNFGWSKQAGQIIF